MTSRSGADARVLPPAALRHSRCFDHQRQTATAAGHASSADSATTAQRAADADRLGGQTAASFQPAGSVQRIDWSVSGCGASGCSAPLLTDNGFSVGGICEKSIAGAVTVTADGPAGTTAWQSGRFSTGGEILEEFSFVGTVNLFGFDDTTRWLQIRTILRSPAHTLELDLAVSQDNNGACVVAGTAISV